MEEEKWRWKCLVARPVHSLRALSLLASSCSLEPIFTGRNRRRVECVRACSLSLSLVYFWHWPPHIAPMCEYRTACAQISLTRIFKYIKRCEREREKKGRNSPFMHYGWTITTGIRNKKPVIHEARIKRLQNTSSRTSRPKEFPLCVYRRRVFCVCAKHKAASSFPPIKHQKMGYDHILLTARDIGCILTEEPASRGSLPIDRAPPPCRIAQEISKDL